MAGFQRKIPDNEVLRQVGAPLLPATLGETIDAAFNDPRNAPFGQAVTQGRIQQEQGRGATPFPGPARPGNERMGPSGEELSEMVPAQQLNEQYGDLGLNFDRPMRREAARILAENKREDLIRQDVIARGPEGVTAGAMQLGASFVRSIMDPINIASAFVPAVGQARYAGMVARMGRTRARLATGAAEGTIGAAVTEPITVSLSRQQQLDYSMADALANVAFGGILGGGVQAAGGKLGDFLQARSRRAREEAMRTAVAQAAKGRRPDVEPVLRADSARMTGLRSGVSRVGLDVGQPAARLPDEPSVPFTGPRGSTGVDEPAVLVPSVTRQGEPRIFESRREAERSIRRTQSRQGLRVAETDDGQFAVVRERPNVQIERKPDGTVQRFANRRSAQKFIDRTRGGDQDLRIVPLGDSNFAVARGLSDRDAQALEIAPRVGRLPDVEREQFQPVRPGSINADEAIRRAVAERLPDRDVSYDLQASTQAQQVLDRAPQQFDETAAQDDIAYVQQLVDDYRAQGLLSEADENLIAEADEIVNRSGQLGQAAREAATCMTRRA
jgi:hypothetical protein